MRGILSGTISPYHCQISLLFSKVKIIKMIGCLIFEEFMMNNSLVIKQNSLHDNSPVP